MANRIRNLWRRILDRLLTPADPTQGRPDEVMWCTICVLSGLPTLFGAPPASLNTLLPSAFVYAWAAALVMCGGSIVGATFWMGDRIKAALVHRAASVAMGCAGTAYALTVLATAGSVAAFAGGITIAFSAARFIRAYQVHRWLNEYRIDK